MSTKVDIKKRAMIEALTKSLGIVTTACKNVGIDRSLHYRWMNEDVKYKEAVEDIAEIALDFAESKLHRLIDKGDTSANIFYMKTKGKRRGYIERQEITGKEGKDIIPTIIFKNFTDE
jgi:hypothetical protein